MSVCGFELVCVVRVCTCVFVDVVSFWCTGFWGLCVFVCLLGD